MNKLKAFIWAVQDRYDLFIESKWQTHFACAFAGMVIGIYLASLVWHRCGA